MKYLHIIAKSAGLNIQTNIKNIPENVTARKKELEEQFPNDKFYIFGGDDISHPVKLPNASNMLAAFANCRTVPTKPKVYNRIPKEINLKRLEICDRIAATGFVKYKSYIDSSNYVEQIVGDDGEYYNIYRNMSHPNKIAEIFKGEKLAMDANVKESTEIFPGEEPIKGIYDYQMLLRFFRDDYNHPLYVKIREFINGILETEDFQKTYTFKEMANQIYEMRKVDPEINAGVDEFLEGIKKEWDDVAKNNGSFRKDPDDLNGKISKGSEAAFPIWMYAIFHQGNWTNSDNIHSKADGGHTSTYMRESRDIDHYRIPVDMELIFEVDDQKFEDALRNGRGTATILDGGVCSIVGYTNFEPVPNFEETWTRI